MSNPYLVRQPFCNIGNKNSIQVTRQPDQDPEDATYDDGFPPETMIPTEAGGLPPKGLDFNGIFYELSSPIAHYCRGDRIQFDASFASEIGGYNKGCVLASNDYQRDYISLIDNNFTDPNVNTQYWAVYAGQGSIPLATSTTTGTVKLVNNLSSSATDAALTAAQGRFLGDIIARFSASFNQNGWVKIPFGNFEFIIQWGRVNASNNQDIYYNIPFPNSMLSVQVSDSDGSTSHGYIYNQSNRFSFKFTTSSSIVNTSWLAIGY